MLAIRAEIRRYVDDSFPGWVECAFFDASGVEHLVVEKVLIVTGENMLPTSSFPLPCEIACTLVKEPGDLENPNILLVDTGTPWSVESTSGETRFRVLPEQVVEVEDLPSNGALNARVGRLLPPPAR